MKKLIALAVAAAAMPAMAAVTLSGGVEVSYSNKDTGTANTVAGSSVAAVTESKTVATEQATLNVAASGELDNGMTVSTGFTLFSSANALSNDGGEGSISVAGSFGTLSVGDVAGPLDGRDGQAAATAENDLSAAFGGDMSIVYALPTIVDGLNISVGMSEENGGDTGVANDATGIAFDYSVAGFKVYAGTESSKRAAVAAKNGLMFDASETVDASNGVTGEVVSYAHGTNATADTIVVAAVKEVKAADIDVTGYGVSYSVNGLTVAANFAEQEVKVAGAAAVKHEKKAIGAAYATGNLTLAYNVLEDETDSAKKEETDTVSASYSLGGGASVYAASTSRDVSKADETTVGIKFSF